MSVTLADILTTVRRRVDQLRARRAALELAAASAVPPSPWGPAFRGDTVHVIAEVKRRSPSAGEIAPGRDPGRLAAAYEAGGASAISVLTDAEYFGGSLLDLERVHRRVSVPVLRKDFLLDPVQVFEARAAGASAVLLIVRALDVATLRELSEVARLLGLARLVEVHDAEELEAAVDVAPEAIGVNSRDLTTFEVDVESTRDVLCHVPRGVLAVAESGLASRVDVERVAAWGADAVLVGTSVARAADPASAVRALVGVPRVEGVR